MMDYLSRPYVQLGLTVLILICGFAIAPVVNTLGNHFDTKLTAERGFALLLLIGCPILIAQAFRTGTVGTRAGSVTREDQPPIFWMTIATYGIGAFCGLIFLMQLFFGA